MSLQILNKRLRPVRNTVGNRDTYLLRRPRPGRGEKAETPEFLFVGPMGQNPGEIQNAATETPTPITHKKDAKEGEKKGGKNNRGKKRKIPPPLAGTIHQQKRQKRALGRNKGGKRYQ